MRERPLAGTARLEDGPEGDGRGPAEGSDDGDAGAVSEAARRTRDGVLVWRIASAFIAFLVALLVFWVGIPLLAPAYLVLVLIGVQELYSMLALRGIRVRRWSLWVAAVLTLPASLPPSYPGMPALTDGMSWRELLFGLFALFLIGLEVVHPKRDSLNTIVYSLFAYLYIPWLLGYIVTLRYTPDGRLGLWYLTLPMLAIFASDVGAYAVGSWLGRRRLAPLISPNKTVEGSLGGLVLSVVVVAAATSVLEHFAHLHVDLYDGLLFSLLVGSAAQLGDLFESLVKRWVGVKDAGFFLPGHGGVLDRIDSTLFAVPITYYFVTLVILR
ncbi:MAG: phosphatidate cytidylyltransferase [Deinococcales bacterium]